MKPTLGAKQLDDAKPICMKSFVLCQLRRDEAYRAICAVPKYHSTISSLSGNGRARRDRTMTGAGRDRHAKPRMRVSIFHPNS